MAVAGYTPGEADQLRRDMAAWRSAGRIEAHRERLISRMIQHGIAQEFAERVFSQIQGFGEYGFPESHAASFALIAYVTAWLRTHHPAAFTCGLLNAQPMGFYSPATIIEDARRHGVDFRPIDASRSGWDCSLEPRDAGEPGNRHAIRMGFRYVKNLGARERARLEQAPGPYPSLEDFVRRTGLNRRALLSLAESGAFECFDVQRRDAMWRIQGALATVHDSLPLPAADGAQTSLFSRLSRSEAVLWDYRSSFHSTRGHPLMAVRDRLRSLGLPTAAEVGQLADGRRARYVGMVICRQRPGNAGGVTFYTLEDETGMVNLVVWERVFEAHETLAKTALLMGVTGKIQSTDGVVHLIADELWDPQGAVLDFRPEGAKSRDVH